MQAQSLVIDKIIAKVDNHYILKSELEAQYQQYLHSGQAIRLLVANCLRV
jgi:peptidyl-prolyl cis-trans isomerase SurA